MAGGFEDNAPVAFSSESVLYTINHRSLGTIAAGNGSLLADLHYSPSFANSAAQPSALKFDSSDGMLWALVGNSGAAGGNYLAKVDVKTGTVAPVGQTAPALRTLAVEPHDFTPPPGALPSSVIFLISGVLALLAWNFWSRSRRPGMSA